MTSRFRLEPDGAKSLIDVGFLKSVRFGPVLPVPALRSARPLVLGPVRPVGRAPIGASYGERGRNRTDYRKFDI